MTPAEQRAAGQLAAFVARRHDELAAHLGFSFRPSRYAPDTYERLRAEFAMSSCARVPLRVSSRFNERVLLGTATNLAFRFWHDCTHITVSRDFSHDGEQAVAAEQLAQLEASGVRRGTLAWRLLDAETNGQNECVHRLGAFPADQRRFVLDCVRNGLDEAIRREQTRTTARRSNVVPLFPLAGAA